MANIGLHEKINLASKILDKEAGLPNSECNALYVDENNFIWAAFGNELVRVDYKEGKVRKAIRKTVEFLF